MNIHGAHSCWKQGALGAAGVRRVWAGAWPQRAAYRGGAYRAGLAHSLFEYEVHAANPLLLAAKHFIYALSTPMSLAGNCSQSVGATTSKTAPQAHVDHQRR